MTIRELAKNDAQIKKIEYIIKKARNKGSTLFPRTGGKMMQLNQMQIDFIRKKLDAWIEKLKQPVFRSPNGSAKDGTYYRRRDPRRLT